ncbi:MAG TPA: glycosyltransferase, partial [Longimicrobiales bacterium]
LVMIEAMACGTPVIAYRCGAVPEVIRDGTSGFIVDNVEDAVAALERVETLSRAGVRADFEERFSAERMALDYVDIYAQLAAPLTKRRAKPSSATQTAGPLLLLPGPRNIGPITTPSPQER